MKRKNVEGNAKAERNRKIKGDGGVIKKKKGGKKGSSTPIAALKNISKSEFVSRAGEMISKGIAMVTSKPMKLSRQKSRERRKLYRALKSKNGGENQRSVETEAEIAEPEKEETGEIPIGNAADKEDRTIFVGNLPTNEKDWKLKRRLIKFFQKGYGEVESARLRGAKAKEDKKSDKMSKRVAVITGEFKEKQPPLIAYVTFKTLQDAEKALAANGELFQDHHLRVNPSGGGCLRQKREIKTGVFVGNLPYDLNEEELREIFKDCGPIEDVSVLTEEKSGRSKGCGYVYFESANSVELALRVKGMKVRKRDLQVFRIHAKRNEGKKERAGRTAVLGKTTKAVVGRKGNKQRFSSSSSSLKSFSNEKAATAKRKVGNGKGTEGNSARSDSSKKGPLTSYGGSVAKKFKKKPKCTKTEIRKKVLAEKLAGKGNKQKTIK